MIDMVRINATGLLIAGLLAVGIFALVMALGDTIATLIASLQLFKKTSLLTDLEPERRRQQEAFDPYGVDHIPWDLIRLPAAALGVGLAALLFWERSPYMAVLGLAAGYVPSLVRVYLLRRAERRVATESRHFLHTLKGLVPAYGGFYPTLRAIADAQGGIVEERLKQHLSTRKNALEIMVALAHDLRSPTLESLAERLQEAQEGLDQPASVLGDALVRIEQETLHAAKEAIGSAPIRLLIPMLILMVPPILVLALYPAVARLMALISGPGPGVGW